MSPAPERFCIKCTYPLGEGPKYICPECGTPFDPNDPSTFATSSLDYTRLGKVSPLQGFAVGGFVLSNVILFGGGHGGTTYGLMALLGWTQSDADLWFRTASFAAISSWLMLGAVLFVPARLRAILAITGLCTVLLASSLVLIALRESLLVTSMTALPTIGLLIGVIVYISNRGRNAH